MLIFGLWPKMKIEKKQNSFCSFSIIISYFCGKLVSRNPRFSEGQEIVWHATSFSFGSGPPRGLVRDENVNNNRTGKKSIHTLLRPNYNVLNQYNILITLICHQYSVVYTLMGHQYIHEVCVCRCYGRLLWTPPSPAIPRWLALRKIQGNTTIFDREYFNN